MKTTIERAIEQLKADCAQMNYECECKGESCKDCYLKMSMKALAKERRKGNESL